MQWIDANEESALRSQAIEQYIRPMTDEADGSGHRDIDDITKKNASHLPDKDEARSSNSVEIGSTTLREYESEIILNEKGEEISPVNEVPYDDTQDGATKNHDGSGRTGQEALFSDLPETADDNTRKTNYGAPQESMATLVEPTSGLGGLQTLTKGDSCKDIGSHDGGQSTDESDR